MVWAGGSNDFQVKEANIDMNGLDTSQSQHTLQNLCNIIRRSQWFLVNGSSCGSECLWSEVMVNRGVDKLW